MLTFAPSQVPLMLTANSGRVSLSVRCAMPESLAIFEGTQMFQYPIEEVAPKVYAPIPGGEWEHSGTFERITIHEPGGANRPAYDRYAWRWTRVDGSVEVDSNRERLLGGCGIRGVVTAREFPVSLFGPQVWRWVQDRIGYWEPAELVAEGHQ